MHKLSWAAVGGINVIFKVTFFSFCHLNIPPRITVRMVSRLTRFDLTIQDIMLLLLCPETTESEPVKQETSGYFPLG